MKLSERIRRNPHIVDQLAQHAWADEVAKLEEGLMQIRMMRLQMPLANCIPVIDALLAGDDDEKP